MPYDLIKDATNSYFQLHSMTIMEYIKKPNPDFWDEKDSFTIEELAYLFYNLEPQYKLPHPKEIMDTMESIIYDDDNIFGIEVKKGICYVPHDRRFLKGQIKTVKTASGKIIRKKTYSNDGVTRFPRQALRQWAIEQQVLHLYDFLQTKEERPLAPPPPADVEPAQPELSSGSTDISGQGVENIPEEDVPFGSPSPTSGAETSADDDVITLPYMTESLKKLAVIMQEYLKDPAHPPKQGYIRGRIDEAFGFKPEKDGSPSRNSYSIACMIEPDAIRTRRGRGRRSPAPKDPPLAEN